MSAAALLLLLLAAPSAPAGNAVGYLHGGWDAGTGNLTLEWTATPAEELFHSLAAATGRGARRHIRAGRATICRRGVDRSMPELGPIPHYACKTTLDSAGRPVALELNAATDAARAAPATDRESAAPDPLRPIPYDQDCCDMASLRAARTLVIRTSVAGRMFEYFAARPEALIREEGRALEIGSVRCVKRRRTVMTRGGPGFFRPLAATCTVSLE